MVGTRIKEFDQIKGLMIFIVIWYHCIQYIAGSTFDNVVFDKINAFNMPVFMIVSGILLKKSLSKKYYFERNSINLILPNIFWGGVSLLFCCLIRKCSLSYESLLSLPFSCWFLSSLFVCRLTYWFLTKLGLSPFLQLLLASALVLFLPSGEYTKYMMPFVGIGYVIGESRILNSSFFECKGYWNLFILLIVSIFLLVLWKNDYSIYGTKSPSWTSIYGWAEYFIRLFVGLIFFLLFYMLFVNIKLPKILNRILTKLSYNSLGLYIIHFTVLKNIDPFIVINNQIGETTISLLAALPLTVIIMYLINLIRNNKVCSLLMLGVIPTFERRKE